MQNALITQETSICSQLFDLCQDLSEQPESQPNQNCPSLSAVCIRGALTFQSLAAVSNTTFTRQWGIWLPLFYGTEEGMKRIHGSIMLVLY